MNSIQKKTLHQVQNLCGKSKAQKGACNCDFCYLLIKNKELSCCCCGKGDHIMTRTDTFPERLSSSSLSTINSCLPLGSKNEPQWKWSRVARECASSWSCVAIFRFSGDFYLRLGKKAALRIISVLWIQWLRFD